MVQQEAVIVRNAKKRYGKKHPFVLDGLNMTVSRGSIYGLLGASACGKTTLLSCVVGVRHLESGEIWVLGGNPGSKGSGIPGPRVGYMPQDISLVGEFSVTDALYYFGRISGLDDEEIDARHKFFAEMLELPPPNHLVKHMSGGQQRRTSFAAALIHSPELVILDEPTVGLDPILRENIWAYLIKITRDQGVTVLITTHYIEETKDANKIGLMRNGKLLAESKPQELLDRFQCEFLEEAFLKLCEAQNNEIASNDTHGSTAENFGNDISNQNQECEQTQDNSKQVRVPERRVSQWKRFKALLAKNGIQFLRYYTGLVFAILFPIVQVTVFLIAIGKDPKNLKIGIVNDEVSNCQAAGNGSDFGNVWKDEVTCHFGNLSCRFLHEFDDSIAIKEHYDKFLDATYDVTVGDLVGVIHFNRNFSKALQARVDDAAFAEDANLLASQIEIFLDMSNRQIGLFLQKKLFLHFLEIYADIMTECKYSSKLVDLPIRFEDPVYGTLDGNFADFMTPTYSLSLIFFLAVTISTTLIITERSEGVWDRSIVQGVKTEEILLSHILIQSVVIVVHTIMIMFLFFVVNGLECKGSVFIVSVLLYLGGFNGLMYGFVISVMCKNHTMANYSSAGSFFPLILLNGCIWPVEGMPDGLRWFSYMLPTTLPAKSLRGLIYKGYSMSHSDVYIGILLSVGWIAFLSIVTVLGLKSKSS